jgi:hypothetical protein
MLDRPEMVEAFAAQTRRYLSEYVQFIARIRRDAEAMWDANPPEGYSTFEGWWRARWVKGPLGDIQEHLEAAVKATFALEARYRKGRHEIPAARQAAKQAKHQGGQHGQPALGSGQYGRRSGTGPPSAARRQAPAQDGGEDFMELIQRGDRSA